MTYVWTAYHGISSDDVGLKIFLVDMDIHRSFTIVRYQKYVSVPHMSICQDKVIISRIHRDVIFQITHDQ